MIPSARLAAVPEYPFARWAVHCRAAVERGIDLIRLDIGNPDLPPPPAVLDAACAAMRSPATHGYPGYRGSSELREAICDRYERRFGVSLDPDREVVCLLGSKEGIVHLQQAMLDPADAVLLPDPGYTPYADGAALSRATIVRFPLRAAEGYLPNFERIPPEVARRAKAIWLNYPNNPTGAVSDPGAFAGAVDFARRYDLLVCHDAPYAEIRHDGMAPASVLQVPGAAEVAIEFNSLSKTFNMAGWRIGYAVGHPRAIELLRRIKSNVDSGMFLPLQRAAVAALATDDAWIEERNAVYHDRLRLLAEACSAAGLASEMPPATHYLWVRLPEGEEAEPFALRLLDEVGVAVAPGSFFGPAGEGFVRISVTAPTDRIREAADRIVTGSRLDRAAGRPRE
jgi:LL-diaminopimelate aminotransferase